MEMRNILPQNPNLKREHSKFNRGMKRIQIQQIKNNLMHAIPERLQLEHQSPRK